MTDGNGNYPLSEDGCVFWSTTANNRHIQDINGRPHSTDKALDLFSVHGKLGLYDGNFVLKKSFTNIGDFLYDFNQDPNFVSPYSINYS